MFHVRKYILFRFAMPHRSGSPRPYFVPSYGWGCCLGSIRHTCDQISPRQRGKVFNNSPHSYVADVVTGFACLESTPDPPSIYCFIWLSVACIDGRRWANADMGCIDRRFAFTLSHWLLCSLTSPERPLFANLQFDIGFTATLILHPATYLNKVLVASNEGDMQLWNIRTQCVESRAINFFCEFTAVTGHVYTNFLILNCAHYRLSRIWDHLRVPSRQ